MRTLRVLVALACVAAAGPAFAFNALGHKVIADIAWQQLDEKTRAEVVAVLRRHPRFDQDFAPGMPDADQDRWIFQHAATWPDQIRGNREYDHPTWHYVNLPLFHGPERPVTFNQQLVGEAPDDPKEWNVAQAISWQQLTVVLATTLPSEKAVAYCWLFHLIGDLHQPLHAVALVCDRFPEGDRGGNSIPVVQGNNLHALWDGLLGRRDRMNDVTGVIAELRGNAALWNVDVDGRVPDWIKESRALCESVVYSPEIWAAVDQPGELAPIRLSEAFLKEAGAIARQRAVAAGLRLAKFIEDSPMGSQAKP